MPVREDLCFPVHEYGSSVDLNEARFWEKATVGNLEGSKSLQDFSVNGQWEDL